MRVTVARHWDGHLPGEEVDIDDSAAAVLVREGVVRPLSNESEPARPNPPESYSGPRVVAAQPYPGPKPGDISPSQGASEGENQK